MQIGNFEAFFFSASNMTIVICFRSDKYKHCLCFLMSIFVMTNVFLVTCEHIKIVNIHFNWHLFNHWSTFAFCFSAGKKMTAIFKGLFLIFVSTRKSIWICYFGLYFCYKNGVENVSLIYWFRREKQEIWQGKSPSLVRV